MILIETFAAECVIRQQRDLVGKLGELLQCAVELVRREFLCLSRMNGLLEQSRRIIFGLDSAVAWRVNSACASALILIMIDIRFLSCPSDISFGLLNLSIVISCTCVNGPATFACMMCISSSSSTRSSSRLSGSGSSPTRLEKLENTYGPT